MSITNEPILLDATGQQILNEMKHQNGYLAMLAEGKRSQIYESMTQIASIVRGNDVERNSKIFPVGDQLIVPWKDMDDTSHNTDETAYQVPWDIVDHGLVTLEDGSTVPGMFIQMHLCSAYGVQFSHQQAFMQCPEGLSEGTYHITFNATWGSKGASAGTSWQFTLTQDVPAGGRLSGFEGMPDQAPSAWRVKSWASAAATEPIETVTVSSGNEGDDLGSMNLNNLGDTGLNSMQAVGYGHNVWGTSALRQYLNKAGLNWWESKEDFDIRPDQWNKHGFMSGFNGDFLNAIKPIKVATALNTVEGFSDAVEVTFDTFFVPSLEQMNVRPQLQGAEGSAFAYWKRRLGTAGFASTHPAIYDALKIPAINANSPQNVRLRSATRGSAYHAWHVYSSGCVRSSYASSAHRFSPVCVIC